LLDGRDGIAIEWIYDSWVVDTSASHVKTTFLHCYRKRQIRIPRQMTLLEDS
jgi:hypothetical protein